VSSYAIDKATRLIRDLAPPLDGRNPMLRYISALFAELTYYHFNDWEMDRQKRIKRVPCEVYRQLLAQGRSANVLAILRRADQPPENTFVIVGPGVVIVGQRIGSYLFIGIRGTRFWPDWKINLQSWPMHADCRCPWLGGRCPTICWGCSQTGKVHRGFQREACWAVGAIVHEMRRRKMDVDRVFLSGHSLGGAISAIMREPLEQTLVVKFLPSVQVSACVFGAPRYGDARVVKRSAWNPIVQVRRHGDMVPTVPPRFLGYADYLVEYDSRGRWFSNPWDFAPMGSVWEWTKFVFGLGKPHDIETYRHEVGKHARADGAELALAPYEKLTKKHLSGA
jgi:hypothetical protein